MTTENDLKLIAYKFEDMMNDYIKYKDSEGYVAPELSYVLELISPAGLESHVLLAAPMTFISKDVGHIKATGFLVLQNIWLKILKNRNKDADMRPL